MKEKRIKELEQRGIEFERLRQAGAPQEIIDKAGHELQRMETSLRKLRRNLIWQAVVTFFIELVVLHSLASYFDYSVTGFAAILVLLTFHAFLTLTFLRLQQTPKKVQFETKILRDKWGTES